MVCCGHAPVTMLRVAVRRLSATVVIGRSHKRSLVSVRRLTTISVISNNTLESSGLSIAATSTSFSFAPLPMAEGGLVELVADPSVAAVAGGHRGLARAVALSRSNKNTVWRRTCCLTQPMTRWTPLRIVPDRPKHAYTAHRRNG